MVSRIKTYFQRFKSAVLPTFNLQVLALIIAGAFCGLLAYLVYMSKAYSYLSNNPEVVYQLPRDGSILRHLATQFAQKRSHLQRLPRTTHKYFCKILFQGYRRTQTLLRLHYA